MDDDTRRKLAADCFRRANEAVAKANWDYAIQMYSQCTALEPQNLLFRQTLRVTEQKKYNNNGTGAMMSGMRVMGIRGKIQKARFGKNWNAVLLAAEEGLAVNPWDAQLNADLGDAARELGYEEVAIFSYEQSLKTDPRNKDVNRALANVLEGRGEYMRASECYERILKIDPTDSEARSKGTALRAREVMDRGGYENASNTQDVRATKAVPMRTDGRVDGPGQSAEADLQRAIRKDPGDKAAYVKLADFYRRNGSASKVVDTLQAASQATGGDINIRELLEEAELDLLRANLAVAKERAQQNAGEPQHAQQAAELARELLNREVQVLASRVERYPNDVKSKFELASRFMRMKKWQQAIPLFQVCRGDAKYKVDALIALGKCFTFDNQLALARRQFESALPDLKLETHPEQYKDAHYTLGRLCEEMKDNKAAEEHYQEVIGTDYGYKDTLQRLNRIQSSG